MPLENKLTLVLSKFAGENGTFLPKNFKVSCLRPTPLLETGVSPSCKNGEDQSLFLSETFEALLNADPNHDLSIADGYAGLTVLLRAISKNHEKMILKLLERTDAQTLIHAKDKKSIDTSYVLGEVRVKKCGKKI